MSFSLYLGDVVTLACTGELFVGQVIAFVTMPDADHAPLVPVTEEECARAAEAALAPEGLAFLTNARRNGLKLGSFVNRLGVKWLPGEVSVDSDEGKALLAAEEASPRPMQNWRIEDSGKIVPHDVAPN